MGATPTNRGERELNNLDPDIADRVLEGLERYAATGQSDVTMLTRRPPEWRLRVGDWRVRFTLDRSTRALIVLRVLPRGRAYR